MLLLSVLMVGEMAVFAQVDVQSSEAVDDLKIAAHSDGCFHISATLSKKVRYVIYTIEKDGISLLEIKSKTGYAEGKVADPMLWSSESPSLYTLKAEAYLRKSVSEYRKTFCFRDIIFESGTLLVNSVPVLPKAVKRHEFSKYGGAEVGRQEMIEDITLMKRLNVNAVESFGVDNPQWRELCDEHGIYVLENAPESCFCGDLNSLKSQCQHTFELSHKNRFITTYSDPDEASDGIIHIFNGQRFCGLEKYSLVWELLSDGVVFKRGKIDQLSVDPQRVASLRLGYSSSDFPKGHDIYLNVRYVLKSRDGVLEPGYEVAHDQILINENIPLFIFKGGNIYVEEYGRDLVFFGTADNGRRWEMRISENTGLLRSFVIGGTRLLSDPVRPTCPGSVKLKDIMLFAGSKIEATLQTDTDALIKMVYYVNADGSLELTQTVSNLIGEGSVGVQYCVPSEFKNMEFYGKGPYPTSSIDSTALHMGLYSCDVRDNSGYYPGMRWVRMLDDKGNGLEFAAKDRFSLMTDPRQGRDICLHATSLAYTPTFRLVIRPVFAR